MTRSIALLLLTAALAGATACNAFREDPENRARGFVETFVLEPSNDAKLSELANVTGDPRTLADGLGPAMTADYLRARRDQGATLKFSITRVERPDALHRAVAIRIRAASDGHADEEIVFHVELARRDGAWHIEHLRGG